jgi:hypothetical protein
VFLGASITPTCKQPPNISSPLAPRHASSSDIPLAQRLPLPRPIDTSHHHLPPCHIRWDHFPLCSHLRRLLSHLPWLSPRRRYGFGALLYCCCRWDFLFATRGHSIPLGWWPATPDVATSHGSPPSTPVYFCYESNRNGVISVQKKCNVSIYLHIFIIIYLIYFFLLNGCNFLASRVFHVARKILVIRVSTSHSHLGRTRVQ